MNALNTRLGSIAVVTGLAATLLLGLMLGGQPTASPVLALSTPPPLPGEGRYTIAAAEKLPPVPDARPRSVSGQALGTTIMSEDFEGDFPTSLWDVSDTYAGDGLEYYWGKDDYRPHGGTYSAWCARGGANGLDPEFNNYPNYASSWMVYGPFDLSDAVAAELTFYYWNVSEQDYDYLFWGASVDGSQFYGQATDGNSNGWQQVIFDLTDVYTLGDVTGQPQVWIGFQFYSDSFITYAGAFLDDIVLTKSTESYVGGSVYLPAVFKSYPPSDKYAVIVGVADFQCANNLNYTDDDARDFRQTLIDYGGFESENIYMLIDSQATKSAIRNAITDWLDSREGSDSLVVIFYSSHGTSASGHEYLVAHDSCYLSQCIRDDEFDGWLDNLESQEVVVIVDTCYSGGMIASGVPKGCQARCGSFRPVDAGETTVLAGDGFTKDVNQEGRIVMTACADDETSIELGPPYGHGLFTYYLLDGLTKSSVDTSGNGWVSAEEVFPYLYPRVVSVNSDQHPQMTDDIAGEVDLTQP
ncbi:MAG: caspase family protein [Anaerolineae bacterium]|nr:caspase family protein [Anaerolineae bacterium]